MSQFGQLIDCRFCRLRVSVDDDLWVDRGVGHGVVGGVVQVHKCHTGDLHLGVTSRELNYKLKAE